MLCETLLQVPLIENDFKRILGIFSKTERISEGDSVFLSILLLQILLLLGIYVFCFTSVIYSIGTVWKGETKKKNKKMQG
jgi:hypothetical protein